MTTREEFQPASLGLGYGKTKTDLSDLELRDYGVQL
ncbi:hypothetical protein C5167_025020 [Papaver somniferum]|uniref:Uncharacterized protein n=1 Tax=Papaver somniferum TaxID=3469 RepID=A0A4Y7JU74_PAPSO|nr:hypothetical protein C5167_025020 [Papaver somniferum]